MLLSGLQSILFAINIDNPNLNIQSKLATSSTTTNGHGESKGNQPIQINSTGDEATTSTSNLSTSFSGNSLANAETTTIKLKKKSSFTSSSKPSNVTNAITSNLRKIKKSNVVVFDDDTTVVDDGASAGRTLMTTSNDLDTMNNNDSRTNSSSNLENQFVFANDENGVDSLNHKEPVIKTNSYSNIGAASNGGSVKKEFSILANPINFIKKSSISNAFMGSSVDSNRSSGSHHKLVKERQSSINNLSNNINNNNINLSDVSPESTSSEKIQELDNCNLIPINSSFNGNSSHLIDNLSSMLIYSFFFFTQLFVSRLKKSKSTKTYILGSFYLI